MANPDDVRRALAGDKNLREADLTDAELSGADLTRADLYRAKLTGARLIFTVLTRAKLTRAELTGAELTGAKLTDAELIGAKLDAADLRGVSLRGAKLHNAKLRRAKLNGADLEGADLTDAWLFNADLTDATFTRAILTRAFLNGAKLNRANLTDATLTDADLTGADLTRAILTRADLTRADLTRADLTAATLHRANLTDAVLTGTTGLKPPVSARGSAYGRASGAVLKLLAEGPQTAREYKRKHPAEFERLKALTGGKDFDERTIRTIVEKTRGARWIVTRKRYTSALQRLCGNANDVLLLNIDLDAADLTNAQKESLRKLAAVSKRSGHPYELGALFTVGWVRYCDGGKVWLVEEVQSDVEATRYGLKDEKTREQLAAGGIDPESFEDAIAAIRPYTERFYEDALGITFALAKQKGIAVELIEYGYKLRKGIEFGWWDDPKIEMDPKKRRKPPPERPYRELPRDMGMARRDRSEVLPDAPAWYYRPNPRRRRRKAR